MKKIWEKWWKFIEFIWSHVDSTQTWFSIDSLKCCCFSIKLSYSEEGFWRSFSTFNLNSWYLRFNSFRSFSDWTLWNHLSDVHFLKTKKDWNEKRITSFLKLPKVLVAYHQGRDLISSLLVHWFANPWHYIP